MNVLIDAFHPSRRDEVVLAVFAVVLRELDRPAIEVVHLAHRTPARRDHGHVRLNVRDALRLAAAAGESLVSIDINPFIALPQDQGCGFAVDAVVVGRDPAQGSAP